MNSCYRTGLERRSLLPSVMSEWPVNVALIALARFSWYIKTSMKAGRPSKYNEEIVQKLCSYIEAGLSEVDASLLVGINPDTFYRWKREKPEFSEAIKTAHAKFKAAAIKNIYAAAKKDWKATAWLLERKYPAEFAKRENVNLEGDTTITVKFVDARVSISRKRGEDGDNQS